MPRSATEKLEARLTKLSAKRQGRPPATDSEVTRRQIMDAALICFGERGYRETTNKAIADIANVTAGTIYHYFKNKRDLFLSIHEAHQLEIRGRLRPIIESDLSLLESLDLMMRVFTKLYIDFPKFQKFNSVVRTESLRNPEISAAHSDHAWRVLYRSLAERGVRTGEVDKKNMRAFQTVLAAIILGSVQHAIEATASDQLECLRGMVQLFRGELLRPRRPDVKTGHNANSVGMAGRGTRLKSGVRESGAG